MLATTSTAAFPVLTALIVTPLIGALVALMMPSRRPEYARIVGYLATAATGGLAIYLLVQFSSGTHGYQFVESHQWIHEFGIRYVLGVDGISLFMVALTALLFPIGLLASAEIARPKAFTVWMLVLESALVAVFLSLDLVLFFVAFEFVLVPMYFLIAGWGHGNKVYAATKFFLYTMAGSAFLFVGLLSVAFLYHRAGHPLTFDVRTLTAWTSAKGNLSTGVTRGLFLAFCVAFAVKVPLFPLHTWLPDAHTEAPTAGSVVLAGVLLKMGTYGFLRFAIPMFPQAAVDLAPILLVSAVIGIVYGAVVAAMQPDLKRLIAYSSIAHLGFVVLGTFALTTQGISGALFTMVSHGLTTGALFLLVGMLYDRRHTRLIADFGGLWKAVPILGGLFVAATFASIGLPGFSGFVGEFLALLGTFLTHRWYAVVATTGVIFAAVYLLWAVQRAFTGEPEGDNVGMRDITFRELATVVPLLGLSLFLGFYPKPVLDRVKPAVDDLVVHVQQTTGHRRAQRLDDRSGGSVIALLALSNAPTKPLAVPPIDWVSIAPELCLFAAALAIVLLRSIVRRSTRVFEASLLLAVTGIAASGVCTAIVWHVVRDNGPYQAINGMVAVDGFSVFVRTVVLIATLLAVFLSAGYLVRERLDGPEYLALMLLSATGMMVMATANDLVVVFLALEILSIALYVLAAFDRRRLESQEAGLKYFVLGAFSSAIFLYGIALTYGATGTTSLTGIAKFLASNDLGHIGILDAGFAFLLVGLGFKVAAAPFHMWTPDVYQGAPTPVTAFMAAATKAAAFAAFLRIFVGTFPLYGVDWRPAVWGLAVTSLVVGTVAALVQTNVKRMLAYSSISHAGYVLIGVQVASREGTSAALFYLAVYAFMVIGAFGVIGAVARAGDSRHDLDDYRGLAFRQPLLAGLLTVFLLAQAGVPLTGGFVAKLGIFRAAVDVGQYPLALAGMLAAVVGAFVYLRIVVTMYGSGADAAGEETDEGRVAIDFPTGAVLAVAATAIVVLGVLPGFALHFARDATLLLVGAR